MSSRRASRARRAFAPRRAALQAELFVVPGKVPLYLEGDDAGARRRDRRQCRRRDRPTATRRLLYVPGAAAVTPALRERLARADVVLFDGTLFTDDEMIATGTGEKTGRRMGHMPIDGDGRHARGARRAARRAASSSTSTTPIRS